eukprot:6214802-Pleurochrysis_carterae.AAC.2
MVRLARGSLAAEPLHTGMFRIANATYSSWQALKSGTQLSKASIRARDCTGCRPTTGADPDDPRKVCMWRTSVTGAVLVRPLRPQRFPQHIDGKGPVRAFNAYSRCLAIHAASRLQATSFHSAEQSRTGHSEQGRQAGRVRARNCCSGAL